MEIVKNSNGLFLVKHNNRRVYCDFFETIDDAQEFMDLNKHKNLENLKKGDVFLFENSSLIFKEIQEDNIILAINLNKSGNKTLIPVEYEINVLYNMLTFIKEII